MGIPTLINTLTASSDATLEDTSSMTSAYDEYMFVFTDMHPATNEVDFAFQVNVDGESGYNETNTNTFWVAQHDEADNYASIGYESTEDLAQDTGRNKLSYNTGNDNDQTMSGILHIFSPANTTYVTHWVARCHGYHSGDYTHDFFTAGYINATGAITDINFNFNSGNIDSGVIQIYGIS